MSYKPINLQIKINTDIVCEPVLLAEMKNFLKVDYTDDDDLIEILISHARKMFEKETNLSFGEKNIFVWLDAYKNQMLIPYAPLLAVNDIFEVDSEGVETALNATDYFIKGDQIVWVNKPSVPIKMDLQVGYDTVGSGATGQTLPESLKIALMKEVATQYENRSNIERGQVNSSLELSNNSKMLLKSYIHTYGF